MKTLQEQIIEKQDDIIKNKTELIDLIFSVPSDSWYAYKKVVDIQFYKQRIKLLESELSTLKSQLKEAEVSDEEQKNCPHTYFTKSGYCKYCNKYDAEKVQHIGENEPNPDSNVSTAELMITLGKDTDKALDIHNELNKSGENKSSKGLPVNGKS